MAVARGKRYTSEEYLAIERAAKTKNEYYCGEMFAIAGSCNYCRERERRTE
jgi:hypothetical protein